MYGGARNAGDFINENWYCSCRRVFLRQKVIKMSGWKILDNEKPSIKCKSGCDAPGRKELVMLENQLAESIVENGITYQLAEDACYYPQLSLEQKTDYVIGKYGIMRGEYMMKYQRHEYLKMLMDGTWNQYLHDVDEECHREVELAVKRIMEKEGVNESLKKENPLEWVRRMNGIKAGMEEQIVNNLQGNSI